MNAREKVGSIVKNAKPLHDLEHKVTFNLHEVAFFQRLISKEVIERIRARPIDYFKALLSLDYFSRIIQNDYSVCDNLEKLSKAIRDKEKKEGIERGDEGASYLNLETVMYEIGLWEKERAQIKKSKKNLQEIQKRYNSEAPTSTRKVDCFYEAMGEMVLKQTSDKVKPYLDNISSRADLQAVIFTGHVLDTIKSSKEQKAIIAKLAKNKYLEASLDALQALADESSIPLVKSALQKQYGS